MDATILHRLLPILEQYAPTLAAVIANSLGLAPDIIITLITKFFDLDSKNLDDGIINDPDVVIKLQQIERDHAESIQSLHDEIEVLKQNLTKSPE